MKTTKRAEEIKSAMRSLIAARSVEDIKLICITAITDPRVECDAVLSLALEVLETKVPSAEFVTFCDSIESLPIKK